jgi:hypothetical protein
MVPKFRDRLIVIIEQGIVFSHYKLNPYREIAKE